MHLLNHTVPHPISPQPDDCIINWFQGMISPSKTASYSELWAYIKWCRLPRCNSQREVIPVYAIKTHSSTGTSTTILNLSTQWRYVVSFMPWQVYSLGRTPWYPLLEFEWAPEAVLLCWTPENLLLLPGVDPWTVQPTLHCTDCAIPAPNNIHGTKGEECSSTSLIPHDANSEQF